jgi:hypothetical protein
MFDSISNKFARSWELFRASLLIIRQNKTLLLFPLVAALCTVVILLFFLAPALLYPSGHGLGEAAHWDALGRQFGFNLAEPQPAIHPNGYFYGYLAVVYLASMFLATFFNTAFYSQILQALAGQPVSVGDGLRSAWSRVHAIVMWSLLAGTVGLIIKALEDRFGWIGRWAMKFVGVVWSVASIFAIPALVREGSTNPLALLRSSAATLRKTWGESLIGYAGITITSWIMLFCSIVFVVGTVALAVMVNSPVLIAWAILTWLVALIGFGYLASVAGHVYRCALYVYASDGVVPAPYTTELLNAAWKTKKSAT